MPYNSHALIRYHVIDRCLQQRGQRWTWRELAAECGAAIREYGTGDESDPAERTIKKDIADMRSSKLGYSAPIEYDRREGSYRYADPSYSIDKIPLGTEDMAQLQQALTILRQFQGFGQVAGVEEIVARLAQALHYRQPAARTVVQLESNEHLKGLHWLAPLFEATDRQQCLQVLYQSFREDAPLRRIVSPYLLKEFNNRWFLIGWEHEKRMLYTLALDRIQQVEPALMKSFYQLPSWDAEARYRHLIGVTVPEDGTVEEVCIAATPMRARYLQTKPLHASQQLLEQTDEYTVFCYTLILNYELEALLLSFGEEVEVLAPAALRERVAAQARAMVEVYGSKPS